MTSETARYLTYISDDLDNHKLLFSHFIIDNDIFTCPLQEDWSLILKPKTKDQRLEEEMVFRSGVQGMTDLMRQGKVELFIRKNREVFHVAPLDWSSQLDKLKMGPK
jgi:hypothetical protein